MRKANKIVWREGNTIIHSYNLDKRKGVRSEIKSRICFTMPYRGSNFRLNTRKGAQII